MQAFQNGGIRLRGNDMPDFLSFSLFQLPNKGCQLYTQVLKCLDVFVYKDWGQLLLHMLVDHVVITATLDRFEFYISACRQCPWQLIAVYSY